MRLHWSFCLVISPEPGKSSLWVVSGGVGVVKSLSHCQHLEVLRQPSAPGKPSITKSLPSLDSSRANGIWVPDTLPPSPRCLLSRPGPTGLRLEKALLLEPMTPEMLHTRGPPSFGWGPVQPGLEKALPLEPIMSHLAV